MHRIMVTCGSMWWIGEIVSNAAEMFMTKIKTEMSADEGEGDLPGFPWMNRHDVGVVKIVTVKVTRNEVLCLLLLCWRCRDNSYQSGGHMGDNIGNTISGITNLFSRARSHLILLEEKRTGTKILADKQLSLCAFAQRTGCVSSIFRHVWHGLLLVTGRPAPPAGSDQLDPSSPWFHIPSPK